MRDYRRQPHLQALDVPAAPSDGAGREADGEATSLLPAAGVVDEHRVAEVDEQRHRRVGNHRKVEEVRSPGAKPSHADPRHRAWPRRDRDVPHSRSITSRLGRSHMSVLRATCGAGDGATFIQDPTPGARRR